jgi:hypothetical protein
MRCSGGCVSRKKAFAAGERLYNELSFLLGAGSFGAAVTAGKFLDSPAVSTNFCSPVKKG